MFSPGIIAAASVTGLTAQVIASASLDNLTFIPTGLAAVDVGNVVIVMSPAFPAASGGSVALAGTNASAFQLTNSGNIPCKVQAKSTTGAGTYSIRLVYTQAGIVNSPFTGANFSPVGAAQNIAAVTLDDFDFTPDGIVPVDVGNVVVTMSPTTPAATGGSITLGGADAADFQLTNSGNIPCKVQAKAATGDGDYDIDLTYAQTGAGNTPFTGAPLVLTGSAAPPTVTLGTITMQSLSDANRSGDIPVNFVFPLGAADLPSGNRVAIFDGSTELDVQEDNYSSDRNGKVRLVSGVAMWRSGSILAGGSKELTVKRTAGSPITGTAISDAAILATDYNVGVTITLSNGTVYTAEARDVLGAASSWTGTNNGGNPQRKGVYRTGPFCVEVVGSVALKTGGTPHPFLRMQCHIAAYKADTGAVDGGNPILYVRTNIGFDNGYIYVAGPNDLLYGAVITVGDASPVNIVGQDENPGNIDLSTTIPAGSLTVTGSAASGLVMAATATRSAGAWTKDDIGRIIDAGSGRQMRIRTFTDSTHVGIQNYRGGNEIIEAGFFADPIPNGTYTTTNWKQYGVCHFYSARWYAKVWWNANADHLTIPDWAQIRASKVFPNWSAPIGNYSVADMSLLDAQGVPATRYKRPFRGCGDFSPGVDDGGQTDSEYINLVPDWFHRICQDFNDDDRRKLEENAQDYMGWMYGTRNEETGNLVDFTDPDFSDLGWHYNFANRPVNPTNRYSYWAWTYGPEDPSHFADPFFPIWFLTGDYLWLEQQQLISQWLWIWNAPAYLGYNRNFITAPGQERGMAWGFRTIFHALMATPDDFTLTIHDKDHYNGWLDNGWDTAVSTYVSDTTNYGTHGPRWVSVDAIGRPGIGFMMPFMFDTMLQAKENELLDANGIDFFSWYLSAAVSATETTGINAKNNPIFVAGIYNTLLTMTTNGLTSGLALDTDYSRFYEGFAKDIGTASAGGNLYKDHGKTITAINASNPAAVIITFNSAYFLPVAPTNAWYVGGWVMTADGGIGLIKSVNAAGTQATVDTTVTAPTYVQAGHAFPSATYPTSTNIYLPMPYPAVYPTIFNLEFTGYSGTFTAYFVRYSAALAALTDMGVSGASAGWDTLKYHWEVQGGLGVGVLPSDKSAPNDTTGGLWGFFPAGMMMTPR